MNCALWLNRRKIYSADEIPDNPDLASLCGYFTAGSLVGWLKSHGGESYAQELEKISPKDPALKEKLGRIFGGQPIAYKEFGKGSGENPPCFYGGNSSALYAASSGNSSAIAVASAISSGKTGLYGSGYPLWKLKLMGSFNLSSYSFTSYLLKIGFERGFGGSFSFNSFSGGSFGYEWEWEWESFLAGYGSFYGTSFVYGSFAAALSAFLMQKYGSRGFSYGSWKLSLGSWRGLFGSMPMSSFAGYYSSFALGSGQSGVIDSDEYDRILMECVFGCKLNGYGYGIHNV